MQGRTRLPRGAVRLVTVSGATYGCVVGSTRLWRLWERIPGRRGPEEGGAVKEVKGRFVAFETGNSNQYESNEYLQVIDLRSGAEYVVAGEQAPIDGCATGKPPTPGPPALQAFVLGANGRAARLYETFTGCSTYPNVTVTGQAIDVIGFHGFHVSVARTAPGQIEPRSLAYDGGTVGWVQQGVDHRVRL